MSAEVEGPPPWDEVLGAALTGKRILVGLTITNAGGSIVREQQIFGIAVEASAKGVRLELEGKEAGRSYWLPPDPRAFRRAAPGEYRLRSTGEVVVDPAYLSTWTIRQPARD